MQISCEQLAGWPVTCAHHFATAGLARAASTVSRASFPPSSASARHSTSWHLKATRSRLSSTLSTWSRHLLTPPLLLSSTGCRAVAARVSHVDRSPIMHTRAKGADIFTLPGRESRRTWDLGIRTDATSSRGGGQGLTSSPWIWTTPCSWQPCSFHYSERPRRRTKRQRQRCALSPL